VSKKPVETNRKRSLVYVGTISYYTFLGRAAFELNDASVAYSQPHASLPILAQFDWRRFVICDNLCQDRHVKRSLISTPELPNRPKSDRPTLFSRLHLTRSLSASEVSSHRARFKTGLSLFYLLGSCLSRLPSTGTVAFLPINSLALLLAPVFKLLIVR